jgi:hypothetical protein
VLKRRSVKFGDCLRRAPQNEAGKSIPFRTEPASGLDVLLYLEAEQPPGTLARPVGPAGAIGKHGEQRLILTMIGAA